MSRKKYHSPVQALIAGMVGIVIFCPLVPRGSLSGPTRDEIGHDVQQMISDLIRRIHKDIYQK
jgi:hypothetical protein